MRKAYGFSLIETAVVILFVSLAMVPIVASMGGASDSQATVYSSNISNINGHKSKLMFAANSIMERAMAGEQDQTANGVGFNPDSLFSSQGPSSNNAAFPQTSSGVNGNPTIQKISKRSFYQGTGRDYSQPISFEWIVRNLSYRVNTNGELINGSNSLVSLVDAERVAPLGNNVISASLALYENPTDTTPILTLPTYFYRSSCNNNVCGGATLEKTGISIVLDTSGSMLASQASHMGYLWNGSVGGYYGAPYLRNRYNISGNTAANSIRLNDIFDDTTLDLTYAQPFGTEDPNTPFTEEYMQPGPNPSTAALNFSNQCDNPASNPASKAQYFVPNVLNAPIGGWTNIGNGNWAWFSGASGGGANLIARLCGNVNNGNAGENPTRDTVANWNTMINANMSRIEGSRNAILSMLVTLEENQFLTTYMKMGFVTFSDSATMRVPLEDPQVPPGPSTITTSKFINMRYAAAMLNRDGSNNNSEILATGNTNMLAGLKMAADDLYNDGDINSRLIIAIGDGSVNSGSTGSSQPPPSCTGNVAQFGSDVGDGSYSNGGVNANGQTITVFSIGIIGYHTNTMRCLAEQTPNGQFFAIDSVADMQPIFDQVAFQIERLVLNSMVQRYNLPIQS